MNGCAVSIAVEELDGALRCGVWVLRLEKSRSWLAEEDCKGGCWGHDGDRAGPCAPNFGDGRGMRYVRTVGLALVPKRR